MTATLFSLNASAAAPTSTKPIVSWADKAHDNAVDNSGNVYYGLDYACATSGTLIDVSTQTIKQALGVSANSTTNVTLSAEAGATIGSTVTRPACSTIATGRFSKSVTEPASYVWLSSGVPQYVLLVSSNTNDARSCPVDNKICSATIQQLNPSDGTLGAVLFSKFTVPVDESKAALVANDAGLTPTTAPDDATNIKCQKSFTNPLTWLLCPMIAGANQAVQAFDGQITCLMQVNLTDVFGTGSNSSNPYDKVCPTDSNKIKQSSKTSSDAYYGAWNTFRSFALALMVIAGLVMVISQAAGFELLDAYTVRKVLPRLLIAGIGITLSWQLMQFLIEITNTVGYGIRDIIYFPFRDFGPATLNGAGTTTLADGAFIAGMAVYGLPGIALLLLTALLGVIVAFITLVLRKLIIIFLLMMAPLAIACYILPNTQKYWKMWWDTLAKALLVFPLIAGMIAIGHVFAATTIANSNGVLSQIIAVIAYFLPYFLIPTAVKMSGGAVGTIAGMVSNRAQGGFNILKKQRAGIVEKNIHAMKSGNRFSGGAEKHDKNGNIKRNLRGKLNRGLRAGTILPTAGVNPTRWKAKLGEAMSRDSEHERAAMMEDKDYSTWAKNDGLNLAALETNNRKELREYLLRKDDKGKNKYTDDNDNVDTQNLNMDIERVERMRQKYEPSAFKQATFFSAVAGGTALNGSDIWRVASQVAGDDDLLLSTLVGQGKSLAMNGGRADQGGGSFTETLNIAKGYRSANKRGGHAAMDSYSEEADRALAATVLDNQGASVLSHPSMKPRMFNILLPEINRRLAVANESGDQDLIDREYAKVANLYDHIASNSNINAARFADEVLRVDPNAPPGQQLLKPGVAGPVQPGAKTTLDRINERRGSSVFQSTRRELSAQEDEARRNSGQSGTINPGSGPTMTPPSSYDE